MQLIRPPQSPSLSHATFQTLRLKYYSRSLFYYFLRKVTFLNIHTLDFIDKKKRKEARDDIFFFCLESSFSSQSLNMKVPKAQVACLLCICTPCEIAISAWFKCLPHFTQMTPSLTPPTSLQNSSLRLPVPFLTSDFSAQVAHPASLL